MALTLQTILESLTYNQNRLLPLPEKLERNVNIFDSKLDTYGWEVVKPEVIQFLEDPQAKHKLSRYFARIEKTDDLMDLYIRHVNGPWAPALKQHLIEKCQNLLVETEHLLTLIQQMMEQQTVREVTAPSSGKV